MWTSPRTWVALEKPPAATLNLHIRDNFRAIGDARTAYTPTFTSGGVAVTLGNGTLAGTWANPGKLVHFTMTLVVGSTTSFTAGSIVIGLPTAAASQTQVAGVGLVIAPNDQFFYRGVSTTTVSPYRPGQTTIATVASLGLVSGTTVQLSGTYEAA